MEFDSVTETLPIDLVSPLNVNGTLRWKLPPLCKPAGLENQMGASDCNGPVNDVPVNFAPAAG